MTDTNKQVKINLYNQDFMVPVPTAVVASVLDGLKQNPKFVAARDAAKLAQKLSKTHTRVRISGNGATDVAGKPVTAHKGNQLAYLNDISGDFTNSVRNIAKNYKIDGHAIEIQYIDVITASTESSPRDTLTTIAPIEKDTVSTRESADRFAWYDVTAKIGNITVSTTEAYKLFQNDAVLKWMVENKKITAEMAASLKTSPFSGWLCWLVYDNALDASQYAAVSVALSVGRCADDVARALKLVYYAKRAFIAQNGK